MAGPDGITGTASGGCEVFWIGWSGESGCDGDAGTPPPFAPVRLSDFWRVEALEPDHLLRLAAEMRLPGRAWLQFEVTPEKGGSLIRQTAIFDPVGLPGLVYWYALWGIHQVVFAGMLRNIIKAIKL